MAHREMKLLFEVLRDSSMPDALEEMKVGALSDSSVTSTEKEQSEFQHMNWGCSVSLCNMSLNV